MKNLFRTLTVLTALSLTTFAFAGEEKKDSCEKGKECCCKDGACDKDKECCKKNCQKEEKK
jgi:hypothetical protein